MSTFREYLDHRQSARAEQARVLAKSQSAKLSPEDFVKMHAPQAWASLQEQVWSVVEHEAVSGNRFFRHKHAIGLGGVVVSFVSQVTQPSASPCLFGLVFSPDSAEFMAGETLPPVHPEHWKMRAARSDGDIVWTRADVPCRHAETVGSMATQIATKLVEYYDRYERACGRDELYGASVTVPQQG